MTSSHRPPCPLTVFTGTKAQLIKLAPLVRELEHRRWSYRLVDTGQHSELIAQIIQDLEIRSPDRTLVPGQAGVATLRGGLRWLGRMGRLLTQSSSRLRRELFGGEKGLCFVHGDTASTWVATLLARRAGQRVAHIEAGLRSHNLLHPFPEELIRILVMRRADLLFAPSAAAYRNLEVMGLADRSFLLPGNTNLDAVARALERGPKPVPGLPEPFALATLHRLETLYSRRRLRQVVAWLLQAHSRVPLVFVLHPPTERRLRATGALRALVDAGVTHLPLQPYSTFLHLVKSARFVLSDGGSVQEEAAYLGTPCLLLRKTTEREEGLGENVVLSRLDGARVRSFLDDFDSFRRPDATRGQPSPSAVLLDLVAENLAGMAPEPAERRRRTPP